jgi:hypothetical protein
VDQNAFSGESGALLGGPSSVGTEVLSVSPDVSAADEAPIQADRRPSEPVVTKASLAVKDTVNLAGSDELFATLLSRDETVVPDEEFELSHLLLR